MNDYVLKYLQSFQNDFYHFIKKSNKEIIIAADLIINCWFDKILTNK